MKLPKQVRQALAAYNKTNKKYQSILTKARQDHERVDKKICALSNARNKLTLKYGALEHAAKQAQSSALESLITACDSKDVPVAPLLVADNPLKPCLK